MIPDYVLVNKSLSPNAKILYGRVLSFSKQQGHCFAGNKYFKEKHNFAPSTTARLISELVKERLVVVEIIKFSNGKYERKIRVTGKPGIAVPESENDNLPF